ncbi:DNA repair protein RAD51 homolog 4 isoform X6 [Anolis carolinensis]|uniref:DNA repair protein RAD51 homolog 4 isoform X6 n=1 Tax=Anolis carolinensis TaxID=28377 RepID=UPI002F2B901C
MQGGHREGAAAWESRKYILFYFLQLFSCKVVVDLASSDLEALAQRCSLSFKGLSSSRRLLLARFSSFPANGTDLFEELHKGGAILPTGTPSLDRLLDTGLYTGEITEFVGAPGSGKTQTCLEIAAHTALVLKQAVLYVDSSGGFSAARLLQILGRMTASQEEQTEALRRVHVMRVFEAYKMLDVLQDLRSSLAQQALSGGGGSAKVLVLDSAWALLSPVLGGRSPDADQRRDQRPVRRPSEGCPGPLLGLCAPHAGPAGKGRAGKRPEGPEGLLGEVSSTACWDPGGDGRRSVTEQHSWLR